MTATDVPPGVVKQNPETLQTAVRTAWIEPMRAWLIVDLVHGGAYSDGTECATWPVVSTPPNPEP
ncbi:hypothetical protein [Mycobacterium sp. PSTR-4-N]|uniref:hypothetical protein n=1 Tax=Mycobacterium sp. PSTR-4-N TaxID=2917745 RepID=UPI001F14BA8A|nr:hypothetical protein [Mycobacterium sp. PSTR-4-N]MCG7592378.1 hypothetical protein [Mycobacterium sp. PSTR-4-N]